MYVFNSPKNTDVLQKKKKKLYQSYKYIKYLSIKIIRIITTRTSSAIVSDINEYKRVELAVGRGGRLCKVKLV